MLRRSFIAIALTLVSLPFAFAATYAEKVKAVDAMKKTLTIAVDGKDTTFKVDDKVQVRTQVRRGKRLAIAPLKGGLNALKAGMEATITTEKKNGEEVVTKIVVLSRKSER